MAFRFKVGQKVSRPIDVYAKRWKFKLGVITGAYSTWGTRFGDYPELYAVRWDDDTTGRAYFPHGIDAQ